MSQPVGREGSLRLGDSAQLLERGAKQGGGGIYRSNQEEASEIEAKKNLAQNGSCGL